MLDAGSGAAAVNGRDGGVHCANSTLNVDLLDAAHAALAMGASEANLSADGCIVFRRSSAGDERTDEVTHAGTVMSRWHYTPALSIGDMDDDGDGALDWHAEVTHGASEASSVVITQLGPGNVIRRRETYTLLEDAVTIRAHVEVGDGSGNLVTEEEFDAPRSQSQVVSGPVAGTGEGTCNEQQAQLIRDAMREAVRDGVACARRTGWRGLEAHFASVLPTRGIEVRCEAVADCASIDRWSVFTERIGLNTKVGIAVNPALAFGAQCGSLREVALHEIMHSFVGLHPGDSEFGTPQAVLNDRTYACTAMCLGGPATQCECASCLRTNVCDPRCASFPPCESAGNRGFVCDCPVRRRGYATQIDCASDCSSGLVCFDSDCKQLDYSCE
jgi:hypothetical protein